MPSDKIITNVISLCNMKLFEEFKELRAKCVTAKILVRLSLN